MTTTSSVEGQRFKITSSAVYGSGDETESLLNRMAADGWLLAAKKLVEFERIEASATWKEIRLYCVWLHQSSPEADLMHRAAYPLYVTSPG